MNKFIPVNEPVLNGNEKKYLIECIESGWISSEGGFVIKFEQLLAEYTGRKYGIAVANGSVALDLAIEALGLTAGDEVILPTFTIISCAAPLVRRGIIPVCIDCDLSTFQMNIADIEKHITPRTKAIMAVHIYGLPVDMDPLVSLAKQYDLKVIEDAAEAHGLSYKGKQCGSFGDVSIFSFYPNKHITTGEGGMVLTDNLELAATCRSLRNLCFESTERFVHHKLGFNYRMSNLQAAVGVAQAERLKETVTQKREIGRKYQEKLHGLKKYITLPTQKLDYAENIYWVFPIVLKDSFGFSAKELAAELRTRGVDTRPFFYPMHLQPVFVNMNLFRGACCPNAEFISTYGLYIPSGLGLSESDQEYVSEQLHEALISLTTHETSAMEFPNGL